MPERPPPVASARILTAGPAISQKPLTCGSWAASLYADDIADALDGRREGDLSTLLAVALGGALGSVLRYGVSAALLRPDFDWFPWGTLTVNVTGSLALGFLARYFGPPHGSDTLFLALTVGLCGGYTTFSTFTLDMLTMVERGAAGRAALYAILSVAAAYAALFLGYQAARALRPLP